MSTTNVNGVHHQNGVHHDIDDESTEDLRVASNKPLLPPAILLEELPLTRRGKYTVVEQNRKIVKSILNGQDDRLLVVVGPCSIHDPVAAREYALKLKEFASREEIKSSLEVVMRVYFEKPRTTVGWKGLINDPDLNGACNINKGLRLARGLLLDIAEMGLPAGCEFLDTISPQFTSDLVTWGAIGARTTESQIHRELASGLSCPVGFKNGTEGSLQIAIDAIKAASHPHSFLGVTKQGLAGIVTTTGNSDCHIILRGSNKGPNYSTEHIAEATKMLKSANLPVRIMIDCSHGNSKKNHNNQPLVAQEVADQIKAGETGIFGVMIESFLVPGRQDLVPGKPLTYGQSVTDACIDFETTCQVLSNLAEAKKFARAQKK